MKPNLYVLAFLTLWTQMDDQLLAPLAGLPPASSANDSDDEFPLVERLAPQEQVKERRSSECFGEKPPAMSMSSVRGSAPSGHIPTALVSTPLYVCMSLQI
jgi:hypothetical protein